MSVSRDERVRSRIAFFALVALSFGLRFPILAADLHRWVVSWIPDDAFYYFQIARRVWTGGGVSFDGIHRATGMHPLWLGLIAPWFVGALPQATAPIRIVLCMDALLVALAAWQLVRAARLLGMPGPLVLLPALAFVLHPWILRVSANGLETCLGSGSRHGSVSSCSRGLRRTRR